MTLPEVPAGPWMWSDEVIRWIMTRQGCGLTDARSELTAAWRDGRITAYQHDLTPIPDDLHGRRNITFLPGNRFIADYEIIEITHHLDEHGPLVQMKQLEDVEHSDIRFATLEVLAIWPLAERAISERSSTAPKRDVPRIDHGEADAPLIAEMRAMIAEGRARNPTDASRALADRATGAGNGASKARRLARRYKAQSRN